MPKLHHRLVGEVVITPGQAPSRMIDTALTMEFTAAHSATPRGGMSRRCVIRHDQHAADERLAQIVAKANSA